MVCFLMNLSTDLNTYQLFWIFKLQYCLIFNEFFKMCEDYAIVSFLKNKIEGGRGGG